MSRPTLSSIKTLLNGFEPQSVVGKEVKATLSLYINLEPQLSKAEVIAGLKEALPAEILFHNDVINGPTILFKILRDYLLLQDFTYTPYPNQIRISWGIANSFFDDRDDKELAIARLNSLRGNPRPPHPTPSPSPSPNNIEEKERKLAHNISQRFKNVDDRFQGKSGEDIEEYFKNYETAIIDYKIDDTLKLQYLHNLFDDEAKRFYRDNVYQTSATYGEAKMKMVAQYNNVTTQNRMRQYLQNLKLSSVMEKENCDVTAGLENLRTQINKFTPLGPPNYRFDESKVEYMYEAVVGHSWAASALTNCFSCDPPWNFDKFCSALNAAWLQEHRHVNAQPEQTKNPFTMLFETQRSYGQPHRNGRNKKKRNYFDMSNVRCWNCNERGHYHTNCPKKRNMTKNVNRAILKNPQKSQRILFEICQAIDKTQIESSSSSSESSSENDDKEPQETNIVKAIEQCQDSNSDSDCQDFI